MATQRVFLLRATALQSECPIADEPIGS